MKRVEKLGGILKSRYDDALRGEKVTQIYLFSIIYAEEIRQNHYRISEIVKHSTISQSYETEISKGIKLAKYVEIDSNNNPLNASQMLLKNLIYKIS